MKKMTMKDEIALLKDTLKNKWDLSYEAIDEIHLKMRASKAPLDELIGLTESNNFRKEVEVSFSDNDFAAKYSRITVPLIKFYNKKYGTEFTLGKDISFCDNKVVHNKNTFKLSRLMARDMDEIWKDVLNGDVSSVAKDLSFQVSKANFVTSFFMLTKCGTVTISTNITDFLVSSNSSWNNCLKIGGYHFAGNIAYMNDGFTISIFKEKNADVSPVPKDTEKYAGRAWAYVFPEKGTMVTPISYGDLPLTYVKGARLAIEKAIANKYGMSHKWRIYKKKPYSDFDMKTAGCTEFNQHTNFPVYFDAEKGVVVAMNKDVILNQLFGSFKKDKEVSEDSVEEVEFETDAVIKHPFIVFAKPMCLKCGREHMRVLRNGLCNEDCNGKAVCGLCNQPYFSRRSDRIPRGFDKVCPECVGSKFRSCGSCSTLICTDKEKMHDVSGLRGIVSAGHSLLCTQCFIREYCTCTSCGSKQDDPSNLTQVDSDRMCKTCLDKMQDNGILFECSCGGVHMIDSVCQRGGVFKIKEFKFSKKIMELMASDKISNMLANPKAISTVELSGEELETYFALRLVTEVLSPQVAEQLMASASSDNSAPF